jgi:hypothetical protein
MRHSLGAEFPDYKSLNHKVSYAIQANTFSQRQNFRYALVELYSSWTLFLQDVLSELFRTQPLLVVGKAGGQNQIQYRDIVKLQTLEKIEEYMVRDVFRKIENQRSTAKLLEDIIKGTEIALDSAKEATATAYLDIRHLIVHADGICDEKFHSSHSGVVSCGVGQEIVLEFRSAEAAIDAVLALARNLATETVRLGLALPLEATPNRRQRKPYVPKNKRVRKP